MPRKPSRGPIRTSDADSKNAAQRRMTEASDPEQLTDITIVYIHGEGPQPAPIALKLQLDKAGFQQDMGERTRLAYWANILHPVAHETAKSLTEDYYEMEEAGEVEDPRQVWANEFTEFMTKQLADRDAAEAPQHMRAFTRARQIRLEILTADVVDYRSDMENRSDIESRISDILTADGGPFIVMTHGLGSQIFYDVVHKSKSDLQIETWMILGPVIQIEPWKPGTDFQVGQILHCFDRSDPLFHDADLQHSKYRDRKIIPLRPGVESAEPTLAKYSFSWYLQAAETRHELAQMLQRNRVRPIERFVIAKDLAAESSDPDFRGPVLIELKDGLEGKTLEERRNTLVEQLKFITGNSDSAQIDALKRFVAANLTSAELYRLRSAHENLSIHSIWKDYDKRLQTSTTSGRLQATTANLGYRAVGDGIHWAVLDSGVASEHPHFKTNDNIKKIWDCTPLGPPQLLEEDKDPIGHGTHIAGIIAGEEDRTCLQDGDQQTGCKGMAPQAGLHVYKIVDEQYGIGRDSWIIKALDHIAALNEESGKLVIHGLNLSLGSKFDPVVYGCGHSPLCRELRRLWAQGMLICVSAGNEGVTKVASYTGSSAELSPVSLNVDLSIGDPANLEESLAVGAVHKSAPHLYGVSHFSSRGPTADGRQKPDLVCPGERIVSCNSRFYDKDPLTYYTSSTGTSQACAHLSGLLAAFLSVRREFIGEPQKVKDLVLSTAIDLKRDRHHQGHGMPNLINMLTQT